MASASKGSQSLRRLGAASAVIALGLATASPAVASPWDLPPPPSALAGNPALLGGHSALARTWASQGIVANAGSALGSSIPFASAQAIPARLQSWSPIVATNDKPVFAPSPPAARPNPSGGPDVFGSVALPIGNTPYDAMWRRASATNANGVAGWTGNFAHLRGGDRLHLLREVNGWVNSRVDFVEDNIDGTPAEIWQNAAESLRRGRGDCEDYALAKLALLAALGFDRDDLFLVIARDLVARSHHAVLAVRTGGRFVILDNATDTLIEGERVNDYRPIFSYSAAGRWIHGFTGTPSQAPIQIASAASVISAP